MTKVFVTNCEVIVMNLVFANTILCVEGVEPLAVVILRMCLIQLFGPDSLSKI
jgi:hypothetical protein